MLRDNHLRGLKPMVLIPPPEWLRLFFWRNNGLAGALFAELNRFVSPAMFSWQFSGEIIVFIIIGGVGRLCGPVIGALVFVALEHFLGGLSDFWHIYLGLLLLGIVLFSKGGLIGLICGPRRVHG